MAEILLNKIINKEIQVNVFVKWLVERKSKEPYFGESNGAKCSRTDFLTYFLNFVHEEIPCSQKNGDISQNLNGCKQNEVTPMKRGTTLLNENNHDRNRATDYPHALHKSLDANNSFNNQATSPCLWRKTSTPKIMKIQAQSTVTLDNGHISPISPLYRSQTSFSTSKNDRQSTSTGNGTPLCLGDFMVNMKSSEKKKTNRNILMNKSLDESSRRIKPTCLNQMKSNGSFRKSDNSFNDFRGTEEICSDSINGNRNFLAEERLKILARKDTSSVASSKKIASLMSSKVEIEPDINCVTNKEELNSFVEIYVSILKYNLVLNITSEIYFLISLLLVKHFGESTNSSEGLLAGIDFLNEEDRCQFQGVIKKRMSCLDLFETVHNVVYFATKCLETQTEVLRYYDKSTLNLLSRNKRLQMFSGAFTDKIKKISAKKSERVLDIVVSKTQTNVCFNLDTDNRENFPNDSAFNAFRKQRDLFYDILRIWEMEHLVTGWDFAVTLGGKIKSLFNLQNEPMTFVHFSRLFKSQLLSTCGRFQKEEGLSDMPFLTSIPNVDADKLSRLNCRLVTKQTSNGINSAPLFTGHQEFYKDFIIIAASYTFNKHLCDTLIAEIVELNDTKFSSIDVEGADGSIDLSTRKAYVACLKSLRTLAKFLGFVESLPYKSNCVNLSDKVLDFQINLRQQVIPTFDVKKILENSIKQNNIILSVPWIAKYLSMLDYITLRLPYYRSVHQILFDLHKNCNKTLTNESAGSNYNSSLINFTLGWLLELPNFPDSEYFNFCTTPIKDSIPCPKTPKTKRKVAQEQKLDGMDIIDQNILYICCPYLEEIKKLLSSNALNSSVTVKHITPVSAVQSSNEIAMKKLEQQLEEAFFNGQPLSLRKTVEFVSERVASACVKHICSSIVPTFKKSALENLKDFLVSWTKEHNVNSPTKEKSLKATLKSSVNQMAHTSLQTVKERCERETASLAKDRVPPSVTNLLSVDVLSQTRDVCIAITTRMCVERVQQWINSHVTVTVFTKDFNNEMQKVLSPDVKKIAKEKAVFVLPPGCGDKSHNENATSAFHLLEKLRGLSINILTNSEAIDENLLANVLNEAYITFTERNDVNVWITMNTCTLLVDVALLLITHKPKLMEEETLLKCFLRVWKCYTGKVGDLFKNLFCPRNVMLLAQSRNEVKVWEGFASFIVFLLKENVLSPEEFETQCMGFYQKEWDEATLRNYMVFLRTFLDRYRSNGQNVDKFTLLVEFLSDFCTDL